MKKFLKWFLIVLSFLLVVFVIGGLLIPSNWTVSKEITVAASKEDVYEQVANLHNWQNWAPWNKEMDPTQVYTYEGPKQGAGAKWLWTSKNMGTGWLEIKSADEKTGVLYELFLDMNGSTSTMFGNIAYVETDKGLHITWSDEGNSGKNLGKRWLSLLIKPILGKEFEKGLEKLKTVVEAE